MTTMTKEQMREFVSVLINNGIEVKSFAKFARVQARPATIGEVIITVLANGKKETSNAANEGDWIVTNPGGEQYIVAAAKFPKKYEPAPELGEGWYKPTGGVQKFVQLSEDTIFVCSWGEEQNINAGGFINVTDLSDIYGIAEQEFYDTYKECDDSGKFFE